VLKLPKDVAADPRHEALSNLLAAHARPLRDGGQNQAAALPFLPALGAELRVALAAGHACQGLELASEKLAAEQKGLDALRRKAPESPQNARVSRVLFLAGDGSARFYRDADALLSRHPERLLVCRLDLPGEAVGEALFGAPKLVRAVLIFDKKAAARALLALVPPA
jgi:hypothetical protein